ncbi:MAG: DNA polymerase III subunit delta [Bacteroidales bacterium]
MAKKETLQASDILRDIRGGNYKPVYCLMGEESYYIDEITNELMSRVLTEDEKVFNEVVLYGADVSAADIINEARFYPSFANHRVVLVREAQLVRDLDKLSLYMQNIMSTTILILNYRNGKIDGRLQVAKEISRKGVLFESAKIYDNQVAGWINSWLQVKGFTIESKASEMLGEFLGCDLARIVKELEKLLIVQPKDQMRITADLVERNIGISKEYNNFELLRAIIARDALKANRIVNYFRDNPRNNPLVVTSTVLYNYFSKLMLCYYVPQKNDRAIMEALGLKSQFQVRDYTAGLKIFSALKCMQIIAHIRECDAKSKGVRNPATTDHELLRELIFRILH